MKPEPITLLYLGRRGGGAHLTSQISKQLRSTNKFQIRKIALRGDNNNVNEVDHNNVILLFNDGYSFRSFSRLIYFYLRPTELLRRLEIKPGEVCVVPMISPIGYKVEQILEKKEVKIIRFIHDAYRHPGDRWPSNRLIRKIIRSSKFVICLSEAVRKEIIQINPSVKSTVYEHPVFDFEFNRNVLDLPENFFLFIGRLREYKGVANLARAYSNLLGSQLHLVIAGEGKIEFEIPEKCILLNMWLPEENIAELISRAEVVVFPYVEASQSGLIPYCKEMNKKIVITPISGLVEQTQGYANIYVTADFSENEIAKTLSVAESAVIIEKDHSLHERISTLESCLQSSGYFSSE